MGNSHELVAWAGARRRGRTTRTDEAPVAEQLKQIRLPNAIVAKDHEPQLLRLRFSVVHLEQ